MKILITGSRGFIGSHLITELRKNPESEIYEFDRKRVDAANYLPGNISDYISLENAFRKSQPSLVLHFAAVVSRRECEETPVTAIEENVKGTLNLVTLCERYRARLIYAGSSEEYGNVLSNGPVVEETPFGIPTSIYSMTKRMAEELVQYYATYKGITATTIRFFMLYGPGELPSGYRSAVIRFVDAALKGETLAVHKDTERAWCYIDDAIRAMTKIMARKQENAYEVFNIGRNEPISSELLAKKIIKLSNSHSEIKVVLPPPTVIPVKRGSFQKAKQLLKWEATVPLDVGLANVIEFARTLSKEQDNS
jgi:nucleoside-diphosphate-sugar epimerase